jgi:hypothetical protein
VRLLSEHRHRCEARVSALGLALTDDAFVFSLAVDGSEHLKPDSVRRAGDGDVVYARIAAELRAQIASGSCRSARSCPRTSSSPSGTESRLARPIG